MFYQSNQDIINKLSSKYRVNSKVLEECLDHVFAEIKKAIGGDEYPNILIHGWGRFKPNLKYIKYKIIYIHKYILDYGETDKVKKESYLRLHKLSKIYERLCTEEKEEVFESFYDIQQFINNYYEQESNRE